MSDKKDYSKLTLEELLIEEKKIKKSEIITAVIRACSKFHHRPTTGKFCFIRR